MSGNFQTRQRGLSLVEVLVTLVVVALGLLGIAGLQVSAVKLAFVSENRSNAVVFVNSLLDQIRANPAGVQAYAVAFGSTPTGSTQADKDLIAFKTQLSTYLPSGDAEVAVSNAAVASCEAGAVAKCSDVVVTLRWSESNIKGGTSGSAQSFMKIAARI